MKKSVLNFTYVWMLNKQKIYLRKISQISQVAFVFQIYCSQNLRSCTWSENNFLMDNRHLIEVFYGCRFVNRHFLFPPRVLKQMKFLISLIVFLLLFYWAWYTISRQNNHMPTISQKRLRLEHPTLLDERSMYEDVFNRFCLICWSSINKNVFENEISFCLASNFFHA